VIMASRNYKPTRAESPVPTVKKKFRPYEGYDFLWYM
jgi:hypothetical protein